MNYPIGLQSFKKIRENGYLYIDKTSYIPLLLQNGQYKFLSRPRRFGKSLFISTLEAFFKGERELFAGLDVDKLIPERWEIHNVIHLDLSGEDYSSVAVLENKLDAFLNSYECQLGLDKSNHSFSDRFRAVVKMLHNISGRQVVILIDEYDNPITSAIGDVELQARFRAMLYGFYSSLKSLDAHLRFCMFTGVTKYGQLSVFSGLNNLLDISFLNEFAGVCGITEEELHSALLPGVEELAEEENLSVADTYELLKIWYDGYHFSRSLLDVYNPYSVINSLASHEVSDFWYRTGSPTILIKSLKEQSVDISNLNGAKASVEMLDNISAFSINPLALFYQTGYLTIKDYDRSSRLFTLGYPNKEVESGLMDSILNVYGRINDSKVLVARLLSHR